MIMISQIGLIECFKDTSINWETVDLISKGWSSDKKYLVKTKTGECLLLRVSGIEKYNAKKKEFEIIKKYSKLGINMSMPVEFGICNKGENVYMLLTWIEGKDLEEILSDLPEEKQYQLGREAGIILRKIHSIQVDDKDIPVETKKTKKLMQLLRYEKSQVRVPGDEIAIKYVKDNIGQIWKTQLVYMHGDYHPGNLIYMNNGAIGVIDFNRWEVGDPYEEFYKLEMFGIENSIPYCIGQIDAYFEDDVPDEFWVTNAVYVAHASLCSIKWAEKFGQKEIDGMVERCKIVFDDYDNFKLHIPKWYSYSDIK
ncbi:MAG: aminoglycoside phosphotransferase family protein [Brotaphodocola sp.]